MAVGIRILLAFGAAVLISLMAAGLVFGQAVEKTYRLRTVVTQEDAARCAADGGLGALVAPLTPSGDLAQDFSGACLLEVK